jgi:hypothetical protein
MNNQKFYVYINRSECAHHTADLCRALEIAAESGLCRQMEVCKRLTFWEDIPVSFHGTFVGSEIPDTF